MAEPIRNESVQLIPRTGSPFGVGETGIYVDDGDQLVHVVPGAKIDGDLDVTGSLSVSGNGAVLIGFAPQAGNTLVYDGAAWIEGPRLSRQTPAFAANMTFDPSLGAVAATTVTANLSGWAIMNGTLPGQIFTLELTRDVAAVSIATTPANVIWLPATYRNSDLTAPDLSSGGGAGDITLITLLWTGLSWYQTGEHVTSAP